MHPDFPPGSTITIHPSTTVVNPFPKSATSKTPRLHSHSESQKLGSHIISPSFFLAPQSAARNPNKLSDAWPKSVTRPQALRDLNIEVARDAWIKENLNRHLRGETAPIEVCSVLESSSISTRGEQSVERCAALRDIHPACRRHRSFPSDLQCPGDFDWQHFLWALISPPEPQSSS